MSKTQTNKTDSHSEPLQSVSKVNIQIFVITLVDDVVMISSDNSTPHIMLSVIDDPNVWDGYGQIMW